MNAGGLSKRIVDLPMKLVGHKPGGLGYVGVIAAMIMASLSGSAVADTAAVAALLVPMMRLRKLPDQPLRWVNRFRRDHCANYSPLDSFYYLRRFQRLVDQQAVYGRDRTGHHDGRGAYAHLVVAGRAIKSPFSA
ncbi:dehydroascorbate transporter [Salmonella enterica subsp. enterica]|nr:dehydroascorbate transporter [Salmonella enterica subsp. enterica]